jgi:hypothetical protein
LIESHSERISRGREGLRAIEAVGGASGLEGLKNED